MDADPGSSPGPEDAEIARQEGDLEGILGARSGAGTPGASDAFQASLRAAFVSGRFEGDQDVGEPLESMLRSWAPEPARPAARRAAQRALVEGWSEGEGEADAVAAPAAGAPRVVAVRRDRSDGRHAARRSRSAPAPARATSHRLRLLVGGSLLATAAALVLLLRGGLGVEPPAPAWILDVASAKTVAEPGGLEGLLVDGRAMTSLTDLEAALADARRIEVGPNQVRVLRDDRYVLELAAGTTVEISPDGGEIVAESGSIRIATGPGFDAARPLAVLTPHVRAEVAGTVFGVDIGADYSCVCCVEGSVRTEPIGANLAALEIDGGETRVVKLDDTVETTVPGLHRAPLVALRTRISETGYWL